MLLTNALRRIFLMSESVKQINIIIIIIIITHGWMIRLKLHSLTVLSSNTLYIFVGLSNLWQPLPITQTWIIGLHCVVGSYALLVIMENFDLVLIIIKGAAHTCIHSCKEQANWFFIQCIALCLWSTVRQYSIIHSLSVLYLVKMSLDSTIHWIEISYQRTSNHWYQ